MIFRIHYNTFFQETSSFPKFSLKQAVRKLSGINLNYTYRLHLVLIIRIYFDKKFDLSRNTSNKKLDQIKNHPHKFPIY